MHVKKQQLEPDMEQQTVSKFGKEHDKALYCHPAYLPYMQSTSCKMPGWMKHKLESRLPEEVSINSDIQIKITADGDCSHEIKRHFLLGRKAMTNPDSILKNRDITLPIKFHLVKAIVF